MFAYNGKNQVETLLDKYKDYLNEKSTENTTIIIREALKTHIDVIELLRSNGADESLKVSVLEISVYCWNVLIFNRIPRDMLLWILIISHFWKSLLRVRLQLNLNYKTSLNNNYITKIIFSMNIWAFCSKILSNNCFEKIIIIRCFEKFYHFIHNHQFKL